MIFTWLKLFHWETSYSLMLPRLSNNECKLGSLLQLLVLFALLRLGKALKDFMLYEVHYLSLLRFYDKFYSLCLWWYVQMFLWFWSLKSQGYGSFLLRDLPFDAIQFCIYEQIRMGYMLAVNCSNSIFMCIKDACFCIFIYLTQFSIPISIIYNNFAPQNILDFLPRLRIIGNWTGDTNAQLMWQWKVELGNQEDEVDFYCLGFHDDWWIDSCKLWCTMDSVSVLHHLCKFSLARLAHVLSVQLEQ